MDDRYPSTTDHQSVHLDYDYPDVAHNLNRWLPLVKTNFGRKLAEGKSARLRDAQMNGSPGSSRESAIHSSPPSGSRQ
jgi:hypothetical protein